jgi:hypothetical protein
MVSSRPLLTTLSGNVEVIARIFPEHVLDKKTNERVEACKIVVAISPPEHSTAGNAMESRYLLRTASLLKARVEVARKARGKKHH